MIEPRIQYVASADGTQIAYTTIGEGAPLVFAANVWGDIAMTLGPTGFGFSESLPGSGLQFVVYDGRGSGSSDRHVTDMSLKARVADLEAVVDRLALERFALMGMIHGCCTAMAYAAKHPERVTRMAIFGAYTRGADYYATPVLRAIRALAEIAEDHWELYTLAVTNLMTQFRNPDVAARIAARYRAGMNAREYVQFITACEAIDVTDMLPLVKAPTLVMRDSTSVFTAVPEFTRRVAAAIPGAEAVTLDGGGELLGSSMVQTAFGFLRGDAPSSVLQSAVDRSASVVTVLFTDIVGHTEMMQRLGDTKGREVLREHERITREVLAKHGGTEVKTMGDGFMASFGSVTKAVECAVASQKAFDSHNTQLSSDNSHEPLNVRVGLNAGEPIEDAGDLFGSSVILASRIAAQANGGEILASMAVRELCSGKGFLFADLGDHDLRGFEDPVRVFEVKWKE